MKIRFDPSIASGHHPERCCASRGLRQCEVRWMSCPGSRQLQAGPPVCVTMALPSVASPTPGRSSPGHRHAWVSCPVGSGVSRTVPPRGRTRFGAQSARLAPGWARRCSAGDPVPWLMARSPACLIAVLNRLPSSPHWYYNSAVGPDTMAALSASPDQFIMRASSIGGVPLRRQHVAEESLGGSGL